MGQGFGKSRVRCRKVGEFDLFFVMIAPALLRAVRGLTLFGYVCVCVCVCGVRESGVQS